MQGTVYSTFLGLLITPKLLNQVAMRLKYSRYERQEWKHRTLQGYVSISLEQISGPTGRIYVHG